MRAQRGFTVAELVVVMVVLGVLAGIAVPRFIDTSRSARLAALDSLAGALLSTATTVRVLCHTNPSCDYGAAAQDVILSGRLAMLNFGWLDSGDNLNDKQIDAWVTYGGFTATLPDAGRTRFTLDAAPDPANCSVTYWDAYHRGALAGIDITKATSGC